MFMLWPAPRTLQMSIATVAAFARRSESLAIAGEERRKPPEFTMPAFCSLEDDGLEFWEVCSARFTWATSEH
jgi:hypothetical protein